MFSPKPHLTHRRAISLVVCLAVFSALFLLKSSEARRSPERTGHSLSPVSLNLRFRGRWEKRFDLKRGETFELSVGLPSPSSLPGHGRVGVRWTLIEEKKESGAASTLPSLLVRKPDAFGVYTQPTADWKKVLHALDPDIYLVYRAPVAGLSPLATTPAPAQPTPFFSGPRPGHRR